jgi:hypothetical protein
MIMMTLTSKPRKIPSRWETASGLLQMFMSLGVTIGEFCNRGRSSVFNDMPGGMVCYGYPCRPVRERGQSLIDFMISSTMANPGNYGLLPENSEPGFGILLAGLASSLGLNRRQ